METIHLNVKCRDFISTVQLKTHQKLRKAIRFVCNQMKCTQENFKFYHNDRELNETDTPISVNLANNDTILMIKHLREEDEHESNMETNDYQSSSKDNIEKTVEMMDLEQSVVTIGINEVPTDEPADSVPNENIEVPSSSNNREENSTKVKLLSTLDSLLMDIRGEDGVTGHAIYCNKPVIQAETQYETNPVERIKLEHATEIQAIKSNCNEALTDANQKIEQLQRQIDELKNEHVTNVKKHVEDAIQNTKMLYDQNQNQKIQELETRCRELQIELQKKEVKSNEDLMSASESAKSQNTRMKFDHQREIQEMTEMHEQIIKKLTDKITKLKNINSGDLMQHSHVLNNVRSGALNLGDSVALNEQIDQLEKSIIETKEKYEFEIVRLTVAIEGERKRQIDLARSEEECQQKNTKLMVDISVLDAKLKKQETLYEKDYEKFYKMLSERDAEIKQFQSKQQVNNNNMNTWRSLMNEQNETITTLRANLTQQTAQSDELRKAKDALMTQYTQKISAMQQAYVQQLQRIGSDMNSGKFAFDDDATQMNAGVPRPSKEEQKDSVERKPLALLSTPIDDANGQERKCSNCRARATRKYTMAFCNATCLKDYFKNQSEQ